MRKILLLIVLFSFYNTSFCQSPDNDLRIVIIRHAEKPLKGNNLTCQGLNRALQLPPVLFAKFGIPAYTYVPAMSLNEKTKHARMFQTIMPMAVKYNLTVNSKYDENDAAGIAKDIKSREGTVLMSWEHHAITAIVKALGVTDGNLVWGDDDFDSIWVITYHKGVAILAKDKEGLNPPQNCPF